MATRQDENKGAKKDGRKWSFGKKENGEVNTLHAHNRSPVHAHRMAVTLEHCIHETHREFKQDKGISDLVN